MRYDVILYLLVKMRLCLWVWTMQYMGRFLFWSIRTAQARRVLYLFSSPSDVIAAAMSCIKPGNKSLLVNCESFYCSIWGWPINLTSVRNWCVVMGLPIVGNNWFDKSFIQISMFRGCLLNYLRNNSNLLKEIRSADSRKRGKLFIYSTRCCPFHLLLQ